MKIVIAFVCLFIAGANAQFYQYGLGSLYGYGDRSCPTELLYSLSSIVSTLYGYGQSSSLLAGVNSFPGFMGGTPYSAGGTPYSAGGAFGYQGTTAGATNPYNPTCPWPIINGMIQQIQQYVNQLQASQQGTVTANTLTGYSTPFSAPGFRGGFAGGMMGPFRRK